MFQKGPGYLLLFGDPFQRHLGKAWGMQAGAVDRGAKLAPG